jgi:crotonobetainyl-CoA:carnitine CoA-transferase CaiB-like acyl-CoA transferase
MDEGKEGSAESGLPRPSQGLGPLAGVRVLELATVIMTPYTGQLLGDLGADVIKVEHGSLDSSRVMGGGPHRELSGVALNLHRNKRSVSLDIKTEGGREVFDRLLDDSDVLLTNLRPGPLRRLHLSYDDVSPSRPSLVYCQSQGFATGTTEEDRPAYDDIVQALAGLPYLNQQVLGTTAFFPSLIGDKIAGLMIAYGVLGALVHRCLTGEGQQVEVPMFDSLLSFSLVEHLSRAVTPGEPAGYSRIMTEHRGPHRTRNGFIAMMPYTDAHWKSLFLAVGRLDILDRPWFVDHRSRLLRADEVYRDLAEIIAERTTEEWLSLCRMHDIPASPVPTLDQIIENPANHRGVLSEANHPVVGTYRSIQSPVRYSATPTSMRRHAPLVAEHTDEILVELGYAPDEIRTLLETGAIRCRRGPAST